MKPEIFYAFEVKSKVTAHWHPFGPVIAKAKDGLIFEISKLPARVFETFISFRIVKVTQTRHPDRPMNFARLHAKCKANIDELKQKAKKF